MNKPEKTSELKNGGKRPPIIDHRLEPTVPGKLWKEVQVWLKIFWFHLGRALWLFGRLFCMILFSLLILVSEKIFSEAKLRDWCGMEGFK